MTHLCEFLQLNRKNHQEKNHDKERKMLLKKKTGLNLEVSYTIEDANTAPEGNNAAET